MSDYVYQGAGVHVAAHLYEPGKPGAMVLVRATFSSSRAPNTSVQAGFDLTARSAEELGHLLLKQVQALKEAAAKEADSGKERGQFDTFTENVKRGRTTA